MVRAMPGHGCLMARRPETPLPCSSTPFSSSTTGSTPKNGRVAEPGLSGVAPGSGLMRMPPVSVCHQVSTTGQRPSPTTSWYQRQASGLIGSPDAAQDAQGGPVVAVHEGIALPGDGADGRGGGVELGDAQALDHLPVAARVRVGGDALEQHGGGAVAERPVDHVGVPGDPADVGHAGEDVPGPVVEHVAVGQGDLQQVAAGGVGHALGLAGGPGGVEQEQGVLAVHVLDGAERPLAVHGFPQPDVVLRVERDLVAGALDDEHDLDGGAGHHRLVHGALERDDLAAAHAFVGGDHRPAAGVVDAVAQALGAEPGEHHVVHGADAGAGQHGVDRLGHHGHVDGDPVALADAVVAQHIGQPAHLPLQFPVVDGPAFARGVRFPDDGRLVAPVATCRSTQLWHALSRPLRNHWTWPHSQSNSRTLLNGWNQSRVVQGLLAPERFRFGDAAPVQGLVGLQGRHMGSILGGGGRKVELMGFTRLDFGGWTHVRSCQGRDGAGQPIVIS